MKTRKPIKARETPSFPKEKEKGKPQIKEMLTLCSQPAEKHNSQTAPMVRFGISLRMEIRTNSKLIQMGGGTDIMTKIQVTHGTQMTATDGTKPPNESS